MEDSSAYVAGEMPSGLDYEVDRLRQQALLSWEAEARTLQRLGLRDGMHVLELGSGPGFITEQLLAMLPTGKVTAFDRDPTLIERSRAYLQGKAEGRLDIIEGSVMRMDFPDDTFDFAYGRLIFQHLPDPVGAAKETLRVLKPGGRLVIGDIDDALHIIEPLQPEVQAILDRFTAQHTAKGGNRHIGRRLPRVLMDAGFSNFGLEVVIAHSDLYGIEKLAPREGQEDTWKSLLVAGLITEDEVKVLRASDKEFYSSDPLVMLMLLMACGEKPTR